MVDFRLFGHRNPPLWQPQPHKHRQRDERNAAEQKSTPKLAVALTAP